MDVQKKLDEIVAAVRSARSMPMSASCVVNRAELLAMLGEVREALPGSLAQAHEVLGDRERVLAEAREEAQRILKSAHDERGSLIAGTQVARESRDEADRILAEARREAEEIRAEADDYVDSKLANFEVVLTKTLGAVDRGREKLLGRGPGIDENGRPDADAPERSSDPEELRRRADAYVDAKLASFEAVLGKTLEAVGRGRAKLLGRRPTDDLADYAALADQQEIPIGQSDADYVAMLAGRVPEQPSAPSAPQRPEAPPQQPPQPGYAPAAGYGDAGGYQEGGWDGGGYGYGHPQDGYPPAAQDRPYGQGQDGFGPPSGYDGAYGWDQGYGQGGAEGYPPLPPPPPQDHQRQPGHGGGGSLDETSFFDTSMIDVQRLRELEGGS
ncbi:hypothetical protein GCM10027168_55460 [Streptomyces capparidis]